MWISVLAIGAGAAIGANIRWLLGLWLNALFPAVPPGTLVANWLGAWLIGMAIGLFAWLPQLAPEWRLFLITGMLGALTTFSTFSFETLQLAESGAFARMTANVLLNLGICLVLVWIGYGLGTRT